MALRFGRESLVKLSSISPALQFCVTTPWPDSRQERPWTPATVEAFWFVTVLCLTPSTPPHPAAGTGPWGPRLTDPFPVAYH